MSSILASDFQISDYKIEDFIPHSGSMVLLDKIKQYDDESLTAEININEESKFFDSNLFGVPAWVGIEYMSQAIAALAGIHAKKRNQSIKLGFLLGTRKYYIYQKVLLNKKRYQISVSQLYKDESGLASFNCKISLSNSDRGNELIPSEEVELLCVESNLNVFETNELQTIL